MHAYPRTNAIAIARIDRLPDGVTCLIVRLGNVDDYHGYMGLPSLVYFEGKTFTKTGWNSDMGIAYYRDDRLVATC